MIAGLGPFELLIILAIVIAIFGAGKLAGVGGALGGSIREFRKSVRDDEPRPAERTLPVDRVEEPRDTTRV
jgi:sec-independent protein translocase protein TatA